jgi:adenosylcobinamide-GDP ribazoletransferase
MLRRHYQYFCNALVFYSRIPGPQGILYNETLLARGSRYFPLIGMLLAALAAGLILLLTHVFAQPLAVLLGMVFMLLCTGAFHEDGLADACDGFGGGYQPEQILNIMKDSRIGTYGAAGLSLALLIKWQSLSLLPLTALAGVLVLAAGLSRAGALSIGYMLPYQRLDQDSKAKPIARNLRRKDVLFAWGFALLPVFFIPPLVFAVALLSTALLSFLAGRYFLRHLGGYTGDCLGAAQQLNEMSILLLSLALLGQST